MSADNWAVCPRCIGEARSIDFGPIVPEVDEELYRTFREDYEFYGADEGVVTASYSGHCRKCGLETDFEHAHRFFGASS